MKSRLMRSENNRGFSLLEMLVVIALGLTMASVTFISLMPLFRKNHVDQAYDTALSVLRSYRNQAITKGNRYIITFPTTSTMEVQFWGYSPPPASSPAPTLVSTITLPQDIKFAVQTGFPNPGPDGFGTGATAVGFNACTVLEGGSPCLIFYPDGSAQDDLGNYNSGVVYLTQPTNNMYSSRAIDIYGTTGRVRGWRIYNQSGSNVWVQQ